MKFTPNYTVSYHGEFHKAGIPFDIEDKDVKEMSPHGVIATKETHVEPETKQPEEIQPETELEQSEPEQDEEQSEDNRHKRGRSKKQEENNDTD